MGYTEDLQKMERETLQAQKQANDSAALYQFYRDQTGSPRVVACTANSQAILAYFGDSPLTVTAIRESLPNIKGLAYSDEESVKDALLREYFEICPGPPEIKRSQTARLKYAAIPDIQAAIEKLKLEKEMRGKSVEELRKLAKPAQPEPEELPEEITRAIILKMPPQELKRLILRFGSWKITERLSSHLKQVKQ